MTEELKQTIISAHGRIVDGWATQEKVLELGDLIIDRRPMTIVEIGILGGKSLIPMAIAAKETGADVWGIDPWTVEACVEGSNADATQEYWRDMEKRGELDRIRKEFIRDMTRSGVERTIRVLMAHDLNVIQFFGDDTIGLLHLDSNHSPEVSFRSVQDWSKKVEHGGLFVMDDSNWKEQSGAVEWLKSSDKLKVLKDHDSWLVLEKL